MPRYQVGGLNEAMSDETTYLIKMLTVDEGSRGLRKRPYASAVAFCPTQVWMNSHYEKMNTVLDPSLSLYQAVGNGVEERIVESWKAHGKLLGAQVKLPNPPPSFKINVGGYMDMVGYDSRGVISVYEIKTTKTIPLEPKPNHFAQAMAYSCLGGFDSVYIIYVARGIQDWPNPTPLVKTFKVDVSKNLESFMQTIILSSYGMRKIEAPARPATFRQSKECFYCDFKDKCWNMDGFSFRSPKASMEDQIFAEKMAPELIALRPSFYAESLSNAKGGAPDYAIPLLDAELARINRSGKH